MVSYEYVLPEHTHGSTTLECNKILNIIRPKAYIVAANFGPHDFKMGILSEFIHVFQGGLCISKSNLSSTGGELVRHSIDYSTTAAHPATFNREPRTVVASQEKCCPFVSLNNREPRTVMAVSFCVMVQPSTRNATSPETQRAWSRTSRHCKLQTPGMVSPGI